MGEKERKKRALISVSKKEGIEDFTRELGQLGFEIVSSGGTAIYLKDKGLEVTDVAEITGYPAILSHRVVTLHPKIHGGILALDTPEHDADLEKYSIERFNLICVDLYEVLKAISKEDSTVTTVMNEVDIGGVALIRGAAKNHKNVIVICDPADRGWVLKNLKVDGDLSLYERRRLAEKVFETMELYDGAIWKFLATENCKMVDSITLYDGKELAYAENRSQNPAHLFSTRSDDPLAPSKFEWVSGVPSFISLADGMQITDILCLLAESFRQSHLPVPYIVIAGKHGNPCGAAISFDSTTEAINKALWGDTVAVMGGEVVTNFPISEIEANSLFRPTTIGSEPKPFSNPEKLIGREKWGLDLVIAPKFHAQAANILGERNKRRLLENPALLEAPFPKSQWVYRQVRCDWLRQSAPLFALTPSAIQAWSGKELTDGNFIDALIAFVCCWRASSNTVALAKDKMLIGLGCGQQDRIAGVRLCLDRANRAHHEALGSVFASDGFFPFAEAKDISFECNRTFADEAQAIIESMGSSDYYDFKHWADLAALISLHDRREGPQLLVDAGCIGGIVPADGKELENVKKFFQDNGLAVGFLPPQFRGFSKH